MRSINATDCWAVFKKLLLIAVAGFNPQAHIEVFRRLRRSVDSGCTGIKFGFGCQRTGGFSNRPIGHTRQRTCAHIAGHPSGKSQVIGNLIPSGHYIQRIGQTKRADNFNTLALARVARADEIKPFSAQKRRIYYPHPCAVTQGKRRARAGQLHPGSKAG
jgi:hypothetical protein